MISLTIGGYIINPNHVLKYNIASLQTKQYNNNNNNNNNKNWSVHKTSLYHSHTHIFHRR
jgi:hypothetical protein